MSQTGTQAAADLRKGPKKGGKAELRHLIDVFGLDPATMTAAERRGAISGYDLRHRIEAMVAGITAKKIKHVYKGDGAATAPGLMILPRIPATHLFPMRHVRVLLGYTAHEISHQLETDFGLLNQLIEDENQPMRRRHQVKEFWNAIEDYRIEKVVRREYPGFHVFIDETRDFSAERFCERVAAGLASPKALANPYQIGAVALTWIGAQLNNYKTRRPGDALALIDGDLRAWLESWRGDIAKVETCIEARNLAERIIDELDRLRSEEKNESPEEKKKADNCTSDGKDNGQGGQGQQDADKGKGDDGTDQGTDGDAAQEDDDAARADGAENDQDPANNGKETGGGSEAGEDQAASHDEDGDNDAQGKGSGATQNDQSKDGAGSGDSKQETEADDKDDAHAGGQSKDDGDGNPDCGGQDDDRDNDENESDRRPPLEVNPGDEEAETEAADLEIEDLTRAINSLKGAEAKDADINNASDLCGARSGDERAVAETVRRGQAEYSALRRDIGGAAARAAGILRRMLQSQHRRTWQGGKEEGDLDFGRLVPMAQGAADIYRQRVDRVGINTAVQLMLDNSGSMSGHPITICQQSAVVLDMAIQGTRTNIEITGFTGNADHPVLYRFRSFGDKGQAASASLGNMHEVDLLGTPVSTPLLEGWRRLQQQKEPRRIMIVVSDGGAEWNDVQPAREAHDFILAQGCRVIGIAIGCADLMRQWCENTVGIESIDDLPIALTTLVQEALK